MLPINKLLFLCLLLCISCNSSNRKEGNSAKEDTGSKERMKHRASASAKQENQPQVQDTLYRISGTEPFWHMVVARPQIFYCSMEGDTLYFEYQEPQQASGRQQGHVQVFELGAEQQLILRSARDCPCSDGMSSKEYPYQATLILKEKVLEGCGRTPENN